MKVSPYTAWRSELKAKFALRDEYYLANAIYPFFEDFQNGKTPQESYESFVRSVCVW